MHLWPTSLGKGGGGMFWLKACPRCRGDLCLERNELGEAEIICIQCGLRRFGTPALQPRMPESLESREGPVAV